MFAHASPSPPSTNTTLATSGPSRPSRLRGLSYLRSYTQNHLSLQGRNQQKFSPSLSANTSPSAAVSTSPNQNESYFPPFSEAEETPPSEARDIPSAERTSSLASPLGRSGDKSPEESSQMMARGRLRGSQNTPQAQDARRGQAAASSTTTNGGSRARVASASVEPKPRESSGLAGLPADQMPTIRFIPHQDLRSNKPSLAFQATSRTLPHEDCVIRVGRYSERDVNTNPPPNVPSAAPVGFKSKVVSRRHCEFWCSQGQWYIKDVKSSSGTFLNHIRLSQPSVESRPFPVNDGDVVQLGIDFRGGEEQIFRCVKIRIECNRAWQKGLNSFNTTTHKRLRALNNGKKESDAGSTHTSECSICLMSIAPCQSLFVAPCSHVWHFKCIRPILSDHKSYPQFLCPNCRAVTDLEADVDDPLEVWDDDGEDSPIESAAENGIENSSAPNNAPGLVENDQVSEAIALSMSGSNLNGASTGNQQSNLTAGLRVLGDSTRTNSEDSPDWVQEVNSSLANSIRPLSPRNQRFALRDPRDNAEGPLTPRNNVGPFVFDGSAGRSEAPQIASLDLD